MKDALIVFATIAVLGGILFGAITRANSHAEAERQRSTIMMNAKHDGHLWVIRRSGGPAHHPDCPCGK